MFFASSAILEAQAPVLTPDDILDIKIKSWVHDLVDYESGYTDVEIIDVNGEWSRGCLQFQDGTWKFYSEKYNFNGDPLNCEDSKELAFLMMKDDKNNWRHWYTSVEIKSMRHPDW